jgi:phosphoglucan,water dikinase
LTSGTPDQADVARPPQPASAPLAGNDLLAALAQGNKRARSWREKLDLVLGLLGDEHRSLSTGDLVTISVFLRFLGTGEIVCSEDGRHFRPGNHARIAARIQERLGRLNNPANEFVLRRIYPWLPSSGQNFQRPEPLTRIRDIAHRNDIEQELKREIKTTLQNKLHRCAGPEDLKTSSALLERITRPGAAYSAGFVEQFKIFHEELKEFFNAQSLDSRLTALEAQVDPGLVALIQRFLQMKNGGDDQPSSALRVLTRLREALHQRSGQTSGLLTHTLLLADIALEDFAFVLLSRFINACEGLEPESSMKCQTDALILGLATWR